MALINFGLSQFTAIAGGLAASIAVGACIGQVIPGLAGESERKVRRFTVVGGLGGLGVAVFVIVLSAFS